jgi:hypothetical protein
LFRFIYQEAFVKSTTCFASTATLVAALAAPALGQSTSVDFFNVASFSLVGSGDTGSVGGSSSVAFDGENLFLGNAGPGTAFNSILDVFGTPTVGGEFGATVGGNGVTNADIDGGILVGVSTNAGANDLLQSFSTATPGSPSANYAPLSPSDLNDSRFDGVAIDPGLAGGGAVSGGGVATVLFGSGLRALSDPLTGALINDNVSLFNGAGGSGFRDLDYDEVTGDVYARTVNGVQVGVRSSANGFQTLSGAAGTEQVFADASGFDVGLNVASLGDFADTGLDNLVIFNDRSDVVDLAGTADDSSFAAVTLIQQDGTEVAANFLDGLGTSSFEEIIQTSSQTGILDFSYDVESGLLAVLDVSNSVVYVFDSVAIPEPTSAALIGLGGLALLARRRRA